MATPAEFLYDSCTCDGGMRNGLRCADCHGRGLVPKGYQPTGDAVEEPVEPPESDGLEDMSITHLRSRAKDLGLSAGGSKVTLVKAIREAVAAENGETAEGAAEGDETEEEAT
jgi:hypothetical protein